MADALKNWRPLADRMRPRTLSEFVGQPHLLAPGKPLFEAIAARVLHSMILWGPPGTGKTTLARLMAEGSGAEFIPLSAVQAGIKDIRDAVARARQVAAAGHPTVLFLDEVHRFNKAQQDSFLPHVEDGTLVFIGATTENPSFEIIGALLSRARVYVLKALEAGDIRAVAGARACRSRARPGRERPDDRGRGARAAGAGGRRRCPAGAGHAGAGQRAWRPRPRSPPLRVAQAREVASGGRRRFDKGGEQFYDQISALHKAVRGSDPDAALYWYARMIDGGCDPHYIARRMLRMASEDIGLADPRALAIALEAWQAYERLGSPEGELAIAEAVVYMAVAAKSNALYAGLGAAMGDVERYGSLSVPMQLRNAPTQADEGARLRQRLSLRAR